jgi:hypothetical protein
MKKKSVRESLLSYMYSGGKTFKLYESGPTGPAGPKQAPVEKDDPDKNAENPDLTELMGTHNSILFLSAPDSSGIIKRGGNLGFIELTPSIIEKEGEEIDLEDFQWYCPSNEFESYLSKTGRAYNKNTGDWTSESEESERQKERKISSYSEFLREKEEALNEFTGIPLLGNVGTNVTGKGLEYQGEDPDFQKGKLNDDQRRLVKFLFTRNHLRNTGKMEKELNITKLEIGKPIEIFVTAFDPSNGKSDEQSMVGITFEPTAIVQAQGDVSVPMVVGNITHLAPNLGTDGGGGFSGVLESVVSEVYSVWDNLTTALNTTTGKIFAGIGAISAAQAAGVFTAIAGMRLLYGFRLNARINALVTSGKSLADATKLVKSGGVWGKVGGRIGNFAKYPLTILKNYRNWKKIRRANTALKGWKAIRYIAFGKKAAKLAKGASIAARGTRVLSGVAKWSNPIGWAFLAADAIGSFMNYTSDNQAPSWDPIVGGEGDAMKKYKDDGTCPNASNSFNPSDVKVGETITLCWTQNPESGFALALSFVVSNSTRTTMNITKILDFTPEGKAEGLSMFLINSANYKPLWDRIKGNDLRFLFIKNSTYEEGYADDNIGAYFLGANSKPDSKDGVLPLSYYGHCDYTLFKTVYADMKDQLVVVADDSSAPKTFNFHFEDSESNVINVMGSKVTDKDLENASSKEIDSFFNVEPVSSYIGNPDEETEEEKKERQELENSAKQELPSEGEDESDNLNPNSEIAKNEGEKWYSRIEESKPLTSFGEFKMIKESLLLEQNPPIQGGTPKQGVEELPTETGGNEPKKEINLDDMKGSSVGSKILTAKQINENFQKILDTVEQPATFAIYFVEQREYADSELRNIYQPGSFMNFVIDDKAINLSDGSDIENHVQVNNLDVLLDAKKGVYNFSDRDRETSLKDKDLGDTEDLGSKASNTVLTSDIRSARDKKSVSDSIFSKDNVEKDPIKNTLERITPDEKSKLDISNWEDVTSVKIIRDSNGNPETVKIKNRKAKFGDKSRKFEKGEPGFEEALALAKANKDKEEEEQSELAER